MNHDESINELALEIHEKLDKMCKGAELICDQIFQDASNRYKVIINTTGFNLLIQARTGAVLIESDPFYITMNKLFNEMKSNFGAVFVGNEYEPEEIRNHKLPDAVLITSQEGDWEALYIHGKSIVQDHKISRKEFLEIIIKHKIDPDQILEFEVSDADDTILRDAGAFPDLLEYLLTDYNEDGTVGESDEIKTCQFDQAWVGKCKKPVVKGEDYCRDHINVKCGCGKQATHNCEQTMGPMICGRNLCDSCRCNH